jgi:tetratricopeptide (TPR) repeat protein
MGRIEKTVFICYRRRNIPWALAIFQNLKHDGYDVFIDYNGIASGDFEQVIVENINARAHFLVLLAPSALERCSDPGDLLRREIETAIETRRNIIPLMLESFSFDEPAIDRQFTGSLAALKKYNGLSVHADYFDDAMTRLRDKYLNKSLDTVLHPASHYAGQAAKSGQIAATTVLTAQEWFERGLSSTSPDEQTRFYNNAIRLKPDFAQAFNNRGKARNDKGNTNSALLDFNEAIRLKPDYALAFYNRASVWQKKDQHAAAISDLQKYLDLGGGQQNGDTKEVEKRIRNLKKNL